MSVTFICYRQQPNTCINTVNEEEVNKTNLKTTKKPKENDAFS